MENFAKKLKELRLEKGLSLSEASSALGLTKNAFANYENGIREPSLDTLREICRLFNVTSDFLLDLDE